MADQTCKTLQEILAEEAARRAQWEAEALHGAYTVKALRDAFELVQDEEHWKNPVRATVETEALGVTIAAVRFFQGSELYHVADNGDGTHVVRSNGYCC